MAAHDKPRRRRLSEHEHKLWGHVTRSVVPLKRARVQPSGAAIEANPTRDRAPTHAAPAAPSAAPVVRITAPASKPAATPAPRLASLERRLRQKLARGVEPIDARIDLHGRTQSQAHAALLRFLRRAQADGARFVLVITGKGVGTDDALGERGVLRRQLPSWLKLPEFSPYVAGLDEAGSVHGGAGAYYVRLRRRRGSA